MAGLVSDQSRGEEQLCSSICPFYVPPSTGWEETIVRTWSIPYGNCEKKRRDMCSFSICSMNHDGIDILFLTLLSINYRRNEGYSIIPRIFVIREGTFLDSLLKYPISFVTRRKKKRKEERKRELKC